MRWITQVIQHRWKDPVRNTNPPDRGVGIKSLFKRIVVVGNARGGREMVNLYVCDVGKLLWNSLTRAYIIRVCFHRLLSLFFFWSAFSVRLFVVCTKLSWSIN